MVIGEFLLWCEHAKPEDRKSAAIVIAREALRDDLSADDRQAAEAALSILVDDPSPLVRRAIADHLSLNRRAPLHMLEALAEDAFGVAAPILARSALPSTLLVRRVEEGCAKSHLLIADRTPLDRPVVRTLVECAELEACLVLLTNPYADLAASDIDRLIARHGTSPEMRGALLADPRLSIVQRQALVCAVGTALIASPLVSRLLGNQRASRVITRAVHAAPVLLSDACRDDDINAFAEHLGAIGQVTSALLLRTLVLGRHALFGALIAQLTGRSPQSVRGILSSGRENGLQALFQEAGLNDAMRNLCIHGIELWRRAPSDRGEVSGQQIAQALVSRAVALQSRSAGNDDLAGHLRSLHNELLRENARVRAVALTEAYLEQQQEKRRLAGPVAASEPDLNDMDDFEALVASELDELHDLQAHEIEVEIDLDDLVMDDDERVAA